MVSRASASEYNCLPDEILLHHVFPKLGAADRVVLSSIDRRTRELVQGEERGGSCRLRVFDFVTSVARLRWALEHGCRWNGLICAAAAAGGHIGVLQWARDQDPPCPWDGKNCAAATCRAAAAGGHLEVLKWLREQNPPCPWDGRTCAEHGCPWNFVTCFEAAKRGHLEMLQWARGQDPPCPWEERTCSLAARGGHLEVLQWAREQDPPCPWNEATCTTRPNEGSSRCYSPLVHGT